MLQPSSDPQQTYSSPSPNQKASPPAKTRIRSVDPDAAGARCAPGCDPIKRITPPLLQPPLLMVIQTQPRRFCHFKAASWATKDAAVLVLPTAEAHRRPRPGELASVLALPDLRRPDGEHASGLARVVLRRGARVHAGV